MTAKQIIKNCNPSVWTLYQNLGRPMVFSCIFSLLLLLFVVVSPPPLVLLLFLLLIFLLASFLVVLQLHVVNSVTQIVNVFLDGLTFSILRIISRNFVNLVVENLSKLLPMSFWDGDSRSVVSSLLSHPQKHTALIPTNITEELLGPPVTDDG